LNRFAPPRFAQQRKGLSKLIALQPSNVDGNFVGQREMSSAHAAHSDARTDAIIDSPQITRINPAPDRHLS
jgi:hypothetical protein